MPKLGVNIDHIATIRQARGGFEPDPISAALCCEKAGADSIVVHLREDRRHINEKDIFGLIEAVKMHVNMEMSIIPEIVEIALQLRPYQATLVPEKRRELTTEGGLDVVRGFRRIKGVVEILKKRKIAVSLFVDPQIIQIDASSKTGAGIIEIHTGAYANTKGAAQKKELEKIKKAVVYAKRKGLVINAGHGLNYENVKDIACIPGIHELNIGHSIVSQAVFIGLYEATRKMKRLVR
ncbi:MAG: pyridoxine 5'-phosphate synthase [Candidatus Omnitrophota bacterium]